MSSDDILIVILEWENSRKLTSLYFSDQHSLQTVVFKYSIGCNFF